MQVSQLLKVRKRYPVTRNLNPRGLARVRGGITTAVIRLTTVTVRLTMVMTGITTVMRGLTMLVKPITTVTVRLTMVMTGITTVVKKYYQGTGLST
jgi:hypothetical protein